MKLYLSALLLVIPATLAVGNSSTNESEWSGWLNQLNDELKNSTKSFLNVTDTVFLQKGDKIYYQLDQPSGKVKWSKIKVEPGTTVEFGESLTLTGADQKNIDLSKEKLWKFPDGRYLEVGKYLNGRQKLYIHDLKAPAQVEFKGLDFFPFDEKSVVEATLERYPKPIPVVLKTTGQDSRAYREVGKIHFIYKRHKASIKVFSPDSNEGMKLILIFFRDASNGQKTYGGGRNLEIELSTLDQKEIKLDFNRSYNPYCARSTHYQCALPTETPFPFAIEAGERLPPRH